LYNPVDGSNAPLLAKSMEWTTPTQLTVTLQPGAMWQDGQPLTADDVVFTFDLAKKFTLSYSPVWDNLSAVKAVDNQTVEFDLSKLNQGAVLQYVVTTYILPKHIWAPIADQGQQALLAETNFSPVGSGPYTLKSYSPQQIVLEKASSYWGSSLYGMPVPKYVVHPIFKSNDDGNLALKQGDLDWSQQFVPNVWTIPNVHTWYDKKPYYLPGSIPLMVINTQKPGLNNPLVRRAIAYSINYPSSRRPRCRSTRFRRSRASSSRRAWSRSTSIRATSISTAGATIRRRRRISSRTSSTPRRDRTESTCFRTERS